MAEVEGKMNKMRVYSIPDELLRKLLEVGNLEEDNE